MQSDMQLKGEVTVLVTPRGLSKPRILEQKKNTIQASLKTLVRDTLYSAPSGRYMGAGGFHGSNVSNSTVISGKDGITIHSTSSDYTTGFYLVTQAHPSDSIGTAYYQWQGTHTEGTGTTWYGASLGTLSDGDGSEYVNTWAQYQFASSITLAISDILTVNWKISVS